MHMHEGIYAKEQRLAWRNQQSMLAQFAKVEEGILIDSKDAKEALILKQITKTTTEETKSKTQERNDLDFSI